MRSKMRRVLPALGAAAVLIGTIASGAAHAADEGAQPTAEQRLSALKERMTVEQRDAVESFERWLASRGEARIGGETAEGRRVARLGGEAMQTVVTRKNPDGTSSTRCVDSAEQYALFLLGDLDGDGEAATAVPQATE